MSKSSIGRPMDGRTAIVACALAALALTTSEAAYANKCPAEHVLKTAREIERAPDVGVTRETLSEVKLTGWRGMGNFLLRTRRLTIAKDGIIPYHTHEDRPSIVYIVKGELIEHNNFCAVPIVHKAGDWSPEFGAGTAHWWANKSGGEVVVISSDVVPYEMQNDPHM